MGWSGEGNREPSHRWQLKPVQTVSSLQESTWSQQSSGQHLNISLQKVGRERGSPERKIKKKCSKH